MHEKRLIAPLQTPETGKTLSVEEVVRQHIEQVLATHDGNVSAAARVLGMDRRTLQRKLRKLRAHGETMKAPDL